MTDEEIVKKFNEYFEKALYSTEIPPLRDFNDTSYIPNDFPPIVPNRAERRKQEKNKSNSNVKSSIGVIGHISTKNKNKENFNKFIKGKVR